MSVDKTKKPSKQRREEIAKIPPTKSWAVQVWVNNDWKIHRYADSYENAIVKVQDMVERFPERVWSVYYVKEDSTIPMEMLGIDPPAM